MAPGLAKNIRLAERPGEQLDRCVRSDPGRGVRNPATSGRCWPKQRRLQAETVGEAVAHVQASPAGVAKGPRARLVASSQLPGYPEKSGWLVLFPLSDKTLA